MYPSIIPANKFPVHLEKHLELLREQLKLPHTLTAIELVPSETWYSISLEIAAFPFQAFLLLYNVRMWLCNKGIWGNHVLTSSDEINIELGKKDGLFGFYCSQHWPWFWRRFGLLSLAEAWPCWHFLFSMPHGEAWCHSATIEKRPNQLSDTRSSEKGCLHAMKMHYWLLFAI